MVMTDPVADCLTRIRNACRARQKRVDIPASKIKVEICKILKEEGFIKNFRLVDGTPVGSLRIFLRYSPEGAPAINHVERVSKPGRRVYKASDDIKPVRNGLGLGIVSTSQGLLSDAQARQRKVGGELLCELW